jgi:hypothetical protein
LRLAGFNYAKKLNLWQDCYKILEDINILAKIRQKALRSRFVSEYYDALSEIFLHNKFYNYHAFFYLNHYNYFKKNPEATHAQKKNKTDKLIFSVLAIPSYSLLENLQSDDNKRKVLSLL